MKIMAIHKKQNLSMGFERIMLLHGYCSFARVVEHDRWGIAVVEISTGSQGQGEHSDTRIIFGLTLTLLTRTETQTGQ